MNRKKMDLEVAKFLFNKQLEVIERGATQVYEVKTFPLNSVLGVQRAVGSVEKGSVLWQHTDRNHFVCMYLEKYQANKYNRDLMDLFAKGIDSDEKFVEVWEEVNGSALGFFPKVLSSKTASERKKQASFIVSDFNKGENENSKIRGSLSTNITHRTHLITFRAIGIERHKGLLIDFDGWLNINTMNKAEQKIINLNKEMDIIWKTEVFKDKHGLNVKYIIYDRFYNVIYEKSFCDDRWSYIWYYD